MDYTRHNWRVFSRVCEKLRPRRSMSTLEIYKWLLEKYPRCRGVLDFGQVFKELAIGKRRRYDLNITLPREALTDDSLDSVVYTDGCHRLRIFVARVNGQYKLNLHDDLFGFEFDVKIPYVEASFPVDPGFKLPQPFGPRELDVGRILVGVDLEQLFEVFRGASPQITVKLLWDRNPDRPHKDWFLPHASSGGFLCCGTWGGRVGQCWRNDPLEAGYLLGELARAYSVENGPYIHAFELDTRSTYTAYRRWEQNRNLDWTRLPQIWNTVTLPAMARARRSLSRSAVLGGLSEPDDDYRRLAPGQLDHVAWKSELVTAGQALAQRHGLQCRCERCEVVTRDGLAVLTGDGSSLTFRCHTCGFTTCEICGVPIGGRAYICEVHGELCPQCFFEGPVLASTGRPALHGFRPLPAVGTGFDEYDSPRKEFSDDQHQERCFLCYALNHPPEGSGCEEVLRRLWCLTERPRAGTPVLCGDIPEYRYVAPQNVACQWGDGSGGSCSALPHILTTDGWACESHANRCGVCDDPILAPNDYCMEHSTPEEEYPEGPEETEETEEDYDDSDDDSEDLEETTDE